MNKAELESRADDALNDLIKDVGIVEAIDILSKDAEEFVAIEKKLGEFLMGYHKSQEYLIDLYIKKYGDKLAQEQAENHQERKDRLAEGKSRINLHSGVTMNIYQKINAVMKKAEYIKKDAKVSNYSAVTHDAVTAMIRQHLVAEGIVVNVSQKEGEFLEMRDLSKEIKQYLYQGVYDISFINIDDANDKMTVTVHAQAQDTGDKAAGKAMSYATKYAMLKTFSLETGDNDESRAVSIKPVNEEQAKQLKTLFDKMDASRQEKCLEYFDIETIEQMPAAQFKEAVTMIGKAAKEVTQDA
jgi:hypothetical protein